MKNLSHFLKKPEGKFIAVVGVIIVLLLAYYAFNAPSGTTPATQQNITITNTDHIRGAKDGKLTLVEFGDFQCPACAVYEPVVRQVMKDNATDLKIVFKQFPLYQIHPNAMLAAKATEAAGLQGKFWEMHDMLYDKQKDWSEGLNAHDFIITYATTIGLDVKKFEADLNDKALEDKILAEEQEGIKLGVPGTPTFFLNGKMLESPRSLEEFDKIIKNALQGQ